MARLAAEVRRAEIVRAARSEFARLGYHGARMSAIAQASGVADGTVYLHFRNKRDLLVAVFRDGIGAYMDGLDAALAGACDAIDELRRLVTFHLVYLGSRPDLARVAQVELRQSDADIRLAVADAVAPLFRRIDAVIGRGVDEGTMRPDVDARIVRRMVFGTLDECVSAWVNARHPYPLASVAGDVAELLLGGIAQ